MNISKKTVILIAAALILAVGAGGGYLWYGHFHKDGEGAAEKTAEGKIQYTCPMHPFIIRDKPGSCPICGMTLVPVKQAGTGQTGKTAPEVPEQVKLSPSQLVMANVATVKVDTAPLAKEISAAGIVQYDQTRQFRVTAWVAGRIDRLHVDAVGAYVAKGRPVAEVYSPDLVSAQQEYLLALKSREQFKGSSIEAISQGGDGLVSSARQRLKLLGVKDYQIAALEKSGQPNIKLSIYTPLSGIVIEKIVVQGQYVNVGDPLFNIADLSTVWVEAEVYESDFPNIKIGQKVDITSQSYPGRTFTGKVSFIYPFLDPKTRTVKVRVQIANPGLRLKPDMFVNVSLKIPLGEVLVAPVAAVMDTGKRKVAWVETEPGVFEPRDVKVGARVGDRLQILSGLARGDKVAASGGYLIDSEAQLRGGAGGGHEAHGPADQPRKKNDLDMGDMKMD
ncbi:MAG: efflux RND transporter periplasmic adaptor subunit [Geobacteraceae bacterium]|nr:efflux RND transporter periplasmic adaptor subunit [Geobacteraceae bacterium]